MVAKIKKIILPLFFMSVIKLVSQVGIGTVTPSVELDIESSSVTTSIDLNNTALDGDPVINFQLSGVTTFSMGLDDTDDFFKVGTSSPSTSTRVTIDNSGNIGISTETPREIIDVYATDADLILNAYHDVNYPSLYLLDADAAETAVDAGDILGSVEFYGFDGTNYIVSSQINGFVGATPGVNDMPGAISFDITADGASTSTERMRITSAGDVGIGTTGPLYRLDVADNTASDYVANFFNDGNNANRWGVAVQCGADAGTGQTFYLDCYDGDGTNIGYIENNGGVFQLVDLSDLTTKRDVKNSQIYGLGIVENLRVVDYYRSYDEKGEKLHTGFIAQEVSQVYPYMVSRASNGKLGLAKEQLIPVVVKATQEQQQEIENLQYQIDLLVQFNLKLLGLLELSLDQNEELNMEMLELANKNAFTKLEKEKIEIYSDEVSSTPQMESREIKTPKQNETYDEQLSTKKILVKTKSNTVKGKD